MVKTTGSSAILGALILTAAGCSSSGGAAKGTAGSHTDGGGSGGSAGTATPGFPAAVMAELHTKGDDKYVGKAPLTNTTTNSVGDTVYHFDATVGKNSFGPVCYLGDPYEVVAHDAGSENLMIFLQGGGACWETLCQATMTASDTIPKIGILSEDPATNVVGGWNIVYAPYCDGSVFSGDNNMTSPAALGAPVPWYFHGFANLTAVVDVAKKQFPNAKRILLAGASAGGYGTLSGTGVIRIEFPHTQLDVFNDSGLGLANPTSNQLSTIKQDWQFQKFVPDSCTDCQTGQLTALIGWGLGNNPTLHVSAFESYNDAVIGGVFLQMQPADFKTLLMQETGKVHDAYPKNFERFFVNGNQHTALLSATGAIGYLTPVDGLDLDQFTTEMLNGDPAWGDHLQTGDGG